MKGTRTMWDLDEFDSNDEDSEGSWGSDPDPDLDFIRPVSQ